MNVYDFDSTIFYPDSSMCFLLFAIKKQPSVFLNIFRVIPAAIRYRHKKISVEQLKETLFGFLPKIKDIDALTDSFVEEYSGHIQKWYLEKQRDDDVIISGSPEFYVGKFGKKFGFEVISTRMDKHTGKIDGINCTKEEKVRRLMDAHPGAVVEDFYSDSLKDTPMARIAEKAYMVKKDRITEWYLPQ